MEVEQTGRGKFNRIADSRCHGNPVADGEIERPLENRLIKFDKSHVLDHRLVRIQGNRADKGLVRGWRSMLDHAAGLSAVKSRMRAS